MDSKKLLLGTLCGTVTSFIVAYIIFGVALRSYVASNTTTIYPPKFEMIVIGHIFFAMLVTYIFLQWASISTVSKGTKAGAIIGLLISLGYNFVLFGTSDLFLGIDAAIVHAIGRTIVWAAAGAGVGWALSRGD